MSESLAAFHIKRVYFSDLMGKRYVNTAQKIDRCHGDEAGVSERR